MGHEGMRSHVSVRGAGGVWAGGNQRWRCLQHLVERAKLDLLLLRQMDMVGGAGKGVQRHAVCCYSQCTMGSTLVTPWELHSVMEGKRSECLKSISGE